jgi:hypothetical protein
MSRQQHAVARNHALAAALLVAACGLNCYADDASTESRPPQKEAASMPTQPATADAAPNGATEAKVEQLHRDLQRVLSQLGVPTEAQREMAAKRLAELADQSEKLARDLKRPDRQLEVRNFNNQVRYAQAQHAQLSNRDAEASQRIAQLRSGAWQTKANSSTNARLVGDFWLLQADLFDINRSGLNRNQRQINAIARIEQFLGQRDRANKERQPDEDEQAMLLEVRLALLRLYDERGHSDKVKTLVAQVSKSSHADDALRGELAKWFGYVDQIGKPFVDKLDTVDGRQWAAAEHQGKVVIIVFRTFVAMPAGTRKNDIQWIPKNLMRAEATRLIVAMRDKRDGAGDFIGGPSTVHVEPADDRALSRRFAVRTVPRYVLIDHTGKVAAVGGAMIGDQMDQLIAASRKAAKKQADPVEADKADAPAPSNAPSRD